MPLNNAQRPLRCCICIAAAAAVGPSHVKPNGSSMLFEVALQYPRLLAALAMLSEQSTMCYSRSKGNEQRCGHCCSTLQPCTETTTFFIQSHKGQSLLKSIGAVSGYSRWDVDLHSSDFWRRTAMPESDKMQLLLHVTAGLDPHER